MQKAIPALAALAGIIGDRQVRNMGTIGGSLANNDPAADYPAAVLGLGATITTNKRKIAADEFFKGLFETALEPGELITSVSFPVPKRAAYMKFKNPASRFALVGVFVADFGGGVRVGGHRRRPVRVPPGRDGEGAGAKFAPDVGGEHQGEAGRPQQRPARLARIPRAPHHGHGEARRRGRAEVTALRRWSRQ